MKRGRKGAWLRQCTQWKLMLRRLSISHLVYIAFSNNNQYCMFFFLLLSVICALALHWKYDSRLRLLGIAPIDDWIEHFILGRAIHL